MIAPQARARDMSDMAKRTGLYPGTFDPITNGHLDIITRAAKMVDHLVIGVAINGAKGPLFSLEERVEMVRHETARIAKNAGVIITVEPFDILLMHFAEKVGAQTIIRGLRAVFSMKLRIGESGLQLRHLLFRRMNGVFHSRQLLLLLTKFSDKIKNHAIRDN